MFKFNIKSVIKNCSGFSIPELMTAVAIGGIMSLAMASVFSFSAQQFNSLISQNEAQESLLLASYYLRATLAQGVNVVNYLPVGIPPLGDSLTPQGTLGVNVGGIDANRTCANAKCTTAIWTAGGGGLGAEPLAVFFRENGGGASPTSVYSGTGIYYRAPNGAQTGRIYITLSADAAGVIQAKTSELYLDNIVGFGIAPGGLLVSGPSGQVQEVNLYIRVRYFKGASAVKDYSTDPAAAVLAGSMFNDLEQVVNIGLRDNILGTSVTGNTTKERMNNGLYFYRFSAPPVM